MALREMLVKNVSSCGCKECSSGCGDCVPTSCPEAHCNQKCRKVFEVKRTANKTVCFNFGSCPSCGPVCGCGDYIPIRGIKPVRRNLPHVCDSEGDLGFSNMRMKDGKLYITIDAFDKRLNLGERFELDLWARLPNMDEVCVESYVVIT